MTAANMSAVAPLAAAARPWRARARAHLGDIWAFAQRPDRRPSRGDFVSRWCVAVLLGLVLATCVSALVRVLPGYPDELPNALGQLHLGLLWVFVLLLAPVSEELIFRAGLRNATYLMFVGPGIIALVLGAGWVAVAWLILASVLGVLWRRRRDQPGGRTFLARRFITRYGTWFWLYTVAFGLVHVSNYQPDASQWPWLPLLVLPQVVGGLVFGYLRIRNGLYSAMAAHFALNLLAVAVATGLR